MNAEIVTQAQLDAMPTCDVAQMMKEKAMIRVSYPNGATDIIEAPTLATAGHIALQRWCDYLGIARYEHAYLHTHLQEIEPDSRGYVFGPTKLAHQVWVRYA